MTSVISYAPVIEDIGLALHLFKIIFGQNLVILWVNRQDTA